MPLQKRDDGTLEMAPGTPANTGIQWSFVVLWTAHPTGEKVYDVIEVGRSVPGTVRECGGVLGFRAYTVPDPEALAEAFSEAEAEAKEWAALHRAGWQWAGHGGPLIRRLRSQGWRHFGAE